MKQKTSISLNLVQGFAVAVLVLLSVYVLATPLIDCFEDCIFTIIEQLDDFSLYDFFQYINQFFSADYLATEMYSMVHLAVSYLPFGLFLGYLLLLCRNDRYNTLLPLSFALMLGIGIYSLSYETYFLTGMFDYYDLSLSVRDLIKVLLSYSGQIADLILALEWLILCAVLLIDGFSKFKLRWISVFCLVSYILSMSVFHFGDILLYPINLMLYADSLMDSSITSVFMSFIYQILDTCITTLVDLLLPVTYLAFWLLAAKREEKALPAEETIEESVEEAPEVVSVQSAE